VSVSSAEQRLRALWQGGAVMAPGVFNALMARMAEQLGFRTIYLSGATLSATHGLPDIGLVTQTEFVAAARALVEATRLPVISDADTGFGEPLNIERTVRLFEAAGVAAIHLEDQEMPKRCGHLSGKKLVSTQAMVSKIKAAAGARRDAGFVLIARTDARGTHGLGEAIARARAYLDAGADMIFPEALQSADEFAEFARQVPAPLLANMTEFGQSPILDFKDLASLGYQIVIYPVTAFRLAMKAAEETLRTLKDQGHQRGLLPRMLTRQELYDYLGYQGYEERDKDYFAAR
jgi:methylisocitrate lyase